MLAKAQEKIIIIITMTTAGFSHTRTVQTAIFRTTNDHLSNLITVVIASAVSHLSIESETNDKNNRPDELLCGLPCADP